MNNAPLFSLQMIRNQRINLNNKCVTCNKIELLYNRLYMLKLYSCNGGYTVDYGHEKKSIDTKVLYIVHTALRA